MKHSISACNNCLFFNVSLHPGLSQFARRRPSLTSSPMSGFLHSAFRHMLGTDNYYQLARRKTDVRSSPRKDCRAVMCRGKYRAHSAYEVLCHRLAFSSDPLLGLASPLQSLLCWNARPLWNSAKAGGRCHPACPFLHMSLVGSGGRHVHTTWDGRINLTAFPSS